MTTTYPTIRSLLGECHAEAVTRHGYGAEAHWTPTDRDLEYVTNHLGYKPTQGEWAEAGVVVAFDSDHVGALYVVVDLHVVKDKTGWLTCAWGYKGNPTRKNAASAPILSADSCSTSKREALKKAKQYARNMTADGTARVVSLDVNWGEEDLGCYRSGRKLREEKR